MRAGAERAGLGAGAPRWPGAQAGGRGLRARVAILALLAASGIGGPLAAQLPSHPRELELPPLEFEVPAPEGLRHQLSNGVAVWVVEDHAVPLVEVSVVVSTGAVHDPPGKTGLAGLTGSMLRRGGTETMSPDAFDEEVDFLGARLDSFGGDGRSGLALDCSPRVLEPALDLLAAALLRPAFDEERLETARANLRTGLAAQRDDPLRLLELEWQRLLWGDGHPRARTLDERSLAAIERQDLVEFHRRHWGARGAVIAVSGDVDAAVVVRSLEQRLGDWETGPTRAQQEVPEPRPATPGLYHVERATPQAKLRFGRLGPTPSAPRDWLAAERFEAILLSELLGGSGPVSRLRRALRAEEGLAYRVQGGVGLGTDGPGVFSVTLETEPAALGRAVAVALAEIERLRRERVSVQELELVRRTLVDAFPLLFDSAEEIAGRFAEDELLGRPHEYWHRYRDSLAAVRPADLQRAAREHLDLEALLAVVVGPWQQLPGSELARRFGRVEHLGEP